mmetsp:Transcript_12942/g.25431  ORF Transcript_12942/g.25431 Transcript_12942/m.25431 type:complete len:87 (-) Transcript_12942:1605-1865(-)
MAVAAVLETAEVLMVVHERLYAAFWEDAETAWAFAVEGLACEVWWLKVISVGWWSLVPGCAPRTLATCGPPTAKTTIIRSTTLMLL